MIESMWEHPLKLHAKTAQFYIRDLSTHGLWYLWVQGSGTQSLKGTQERGQGFSGLLLLPLPWTLSQVLSPSS